MKFNIEPVESFGITHTSISVAGIGDHWGQSYVMRVSILDQNGTIASEREISVGQEDYAKINWNEYEDLLKIIENICKVTIIRE